jgi:hypothetical protein
MVTGYRVLKMCNGLCRRAKRLRECTGISLPYKTRISTREPLMAAAITDLRRNEMRMKRRLCDTRTPTHKMNVNGKLDRTPADKT